MAAPMVIIGDAFHNFLDGVVIGTAVRTSIPLGISTALAVATHEIPQELGDMAILLHAGYSRRKALILNLLSGASAVLGAVARRVRARLGAADQPVRAVGRRRRFPVRRDGRSHSRSASRPNRRDAPSGSSALARWPASAPSSGLNAIRRRTLMYAIWPSFVTVGRSKKCSCIRTRTRVSARAEREGRADRVGPDEPAVRRHAACSAFPTTMQGARRRPRQRSVLQTGVAQYELIGWAPVIGKDDLDRL